MGIRRSQLAASQSAKIIAALTKASDAYRQQIELGLDDNPRETAKARIIIRDLLGPIQMCPGPDGGLWAEYNTRPAALARKAVGASVELTGFGGSLRPIATTTEPIAVLDVPLIAA